MAKQDFDTESTEMEETESGPEQTEDGREPGARAPEELAQLRKERDGLLDRLARLQAEFDNFRKRAAKEQGEFRDYALAETATSLLPVIDNFDLALRANSSGEELRKGVELIRKQLGDLLERVGLKRVAAKGEVFDPRVHEAIEMVETDEAEDNHVLEELQPGYRLKDRLLRPAMVRVAKNHNR